MGVPFLHDYKEYILDKNNFLLDFIKAIFTKRIAIISNDLTCFLIGMLPM